MRHRLSIALLLFALWGSQALVASAQGRFAKLSPASSPHVLVSDTVEEAAPPSPSKSSGPMSLDACIDLGYQHQPALAAARASLSAAQSGQRGLDRLIIPRLIQKDLPIRQQQACQGVTIAGAALTQAEAEMRYAVTRNFFTVQYIRSQQQVVADVLRSLENGHARATKIFEAAELNTKITQIDLDSIKLQIGLVEQKKSQADNGMLKALAALREAMGLGYDYPLEIAVVDLPQAVYETKTTVEKDGKDDKGKVTKVKVVEITYHPTYSFNKAELINAAIANRPEMSQANAASVVFELEVQAQSMNRGYRQPTFAQGGDPHVQPIPQGRANGEYSPGAFGLEAPSMLAGRKADRVQRARDLLDRARAVVDKANNLVSLDVEVQYLKWQEAVDDIQSLKRIYKTAQVMPDRVMKFMQGKELTGAAIIQANTVAIHVRTSLNEEMHVHALALAGLERATAGAFRIYPVPTK
jgi:predicted transcriptional regulator